ncbi:hypothetical protein IAT38_002053 [Cryptococcus sp. DSM 104549]
MSLLVSPSKASPAPHARPLPPGGHRKRLSTSLSPSPRSVPGARLGVSRETTPTPVAGIEEALMSPGRDRDGTMGGLRERSEDELQRAGKDALVHALREEWEMRDKLAAKIETLETEREKLESGSEDVLKTMAALQARADEAFAEQNRMEADLEERDQLLESLKRRVSKADKQVKESQKRYADQESAFEVERQALQAQEAHFQKRVAALQAAARSTPTTTAPSTPSESQTVSSLKEELISLNLSHSTILAKFNNLTKEVQELKLANLELQEENEGWEFLMRERTFSGKVRERGGILGMASADSDSQESEPPLSAGSRRRRTRTVSGLASLDESLEDEMDGLHSDLDAQSPIFDEEHQFITDLDHGIHGNSLAPPSKRRGKKVKGDNLGDLPVTGGGLDLAAELGRAEVHLDGNKMRVLGKGDEGEALRTEVKQLREANKALSLYCSKIIDRIIAQEGYEHILSVDYKTRRAAGSRNVSGASRLTIKEIAAPATASFEETAAPSALSPTEALKEKKGRPLSMMVRAWSGTGEKTRVAEPAPITPVEPVAVEARAEKRARRGFSLDFRSLGFGGSTPDSEPKPALKPLTLASRASSATANEIPAPRSSSILARKLEPQEEDEEDRRERHRMEASLKLMGITSPPEGDGAVTPRGSTSEGRKSPWYRLSSAIGTSEPQQLNSLDQNDPEAALKAFDAKEAEKIAALAQGKAETGYTSPPKLGSRKSSTSGRDRSVSKSESVHTLWSLGGSSRPASQEIVPEETTTK